MDRCSVAVPVSILRGITMGRKALDVSEGQKFGRLLVVRRGPTSNSGHIRYICKCDCGKEKTVSGAALKTGNTQSCGCFLHDVLEKRNTKHGLSRTEIGRAH